MNCMVAVVGIGVEVGGGWVVGYGNCFVFTPKRDFFPKHRVLEFQTFSTSS